MTRKLCSCSLLMLVLLSLAGVSQAQTAVARPHTGHPQMLSAGALAAVPPPYETPASLACVYHLATPLVAGCPVLGTTAVPTGGSGIIAVVTAFDHPRAIGDLNVFSKNFGLPLCGSSNPCFKKVFATGTKPPMDPLWAQTAAQVIEYAHAFAPKAQIMLVEAASSAITDMWDAVDVASAKLVLHGGGQMILPFSILEESDETIFDSHFTAPGVIYISGNQGGLGFFDYPAASPNVLALGGSGLIRDSKGNFVSEVATSFWAGGQSLFEKRPSYQKGIATIVGTHRGIPDAAFASDPITGAVLFYTSVSLNGFVGWLFSGNIGIAEAAWAGMINRAGSHAANTPAELTMLYQHLGDKTIFRDITQGQAFGIQAKPGWDFLTGLGSTFGLKGK